MKSIRLLREIIGIDQKTLSDAAGVHRKQLSLYENGHVFPSRRVCQRLDDAIEGIIDTRALAAAEALRRVPPGPELEDDGLIGR